MASLQTELHVADQHLDQRCHRVSKRIDLLAHLLRWHFAQSGRNLKQRLVNSRGDVTHLGDNLHTLYPLDVATGFRVDLRAQRNPVSLSTKTKASLLTAPAEVEVLVVVA